MVPALPVGCLRVSHGKVLRITVPANWRQINGEMLTYAPDGGFHIDGRGGAHPGLRQEEQEPAK